MRYIPHTPDDIRKMLSAVGLTDAEELFRSIPASLRLKSPMNLPPPLSEPELLAHLRRFSEENTAARFSAFLGGGAYRHHVPAAVDQLLMRGEFFTAYTPYQPEVSQGTLQAIFEFQTMIARLFGMEVANASMYDGASACAEAVLMACRISRKSKVLVSAALAPNHRRVIETYAQFQDIEILSIPIRADGRTDDAALAGMLSDAAAVVVQSPNYFGVIEDLSAFQKVLAGSATQFVATFTEPLAYGLLKAPGDAGADIVAGEGASFGIPVSFGGPYLGLFASRKKYARMMPGRICGETTDSEGRRGYVLTLATREQHIRREKATSNICTNEALCALACSIYLALHGKHGLARLARLNHDLAEYAKSALASAGAKIRFSAPTFNEFVATLPVSAKRFMDAGLSEGIIPGLPLEGRAGFGDNDLLVCATEINSKDDIDRLGAVLKKLT